MNIGDRLGKFYKNARTWVGEQVVGDDFGYASSRNLKDHLKLGVAGGAALGATVGTVAGMYEQATNEVSEHWVKHNIVDPELKGYHYSVRADWDEDCHTIGDIEYCDDELDGWWHRYTPRINNRVVGDYEKPEFRHSTQLTVISGAAKGAAIGAGVGLVVGLSTGLLTNAMAGGSPHKPRLPEEVREQLIQDSGNQAFQGAMLGAGIGGVLGLGAGLYEQATQTVATRRWFEPLTEPKNLGSIPKTHYEWNWGSDWNDPSDRSNDWSHGQVDVVRDVPVYSGDTPRTVDVTRTFRTARFTPLTGLVAGAALGAGVGFAAGVASGVVNKLVLENS